MIKRTIENQTREQASELFDIIYNNDRTSVYVGEECVIGNVIRATYNPKSMTIEIVSDALSTKAGLDDYLKDNR